MSEVQIINENIEFLEKNLLNALLMSHYELIVSIIQDAYSLY